MLFLAGIEAMLPGLVRSGPDGIERKKGSVGMSGARRSGQDGKVGKKGSVGMPGARSGGSKLS